MTKQDLEQQIKIIETKNMAMEKFIFQLGKFIDTNLQPFRDDIADFDDERNKGILAVLNCLVEQYNKLCSFHKIEPLPAYKNEIVKFKIIEEKEHKNDR